VPLDRKRGNREQADRVARSGAGGSNFLNRFGHATDDGDDGYMEGLGLPPSPVERQSLPFAASPMSTTRSPRSPREGMLEQGSFAASEVGLGRGVSEASRGRAHDVGLSQSQSAVDALG